jgi:hypothetical protein
MGKGARNRLNRAAAKQTPEFRAARREIYRQVNNELHLSTERFFRDETSVILWVLHDTFGFGKDRLKRFYVNYEKVNADLRKHYSMSNSDMRYITDRLLKDIGVDLDEWEHDNVGVTISASQ